MKYLSKYIRMAAGILLLYSAASCTYDYFVDENNCCIYVPQVQNGTIQDFYIAFHDQTGAHMRTSHIHASFDNNELMQEGKLRFKLKPGETKVTCFAQIKELDCCVGQPYAESCLSIPPVEGAEHTFCPPSANSSAQTQATGTDPNHARFAKTSLSLIPIGHPDANKVHTIDIDEEQTYNGKITHQFKGLAGLGVTRIKICYTGLATRLFFDGRFGNFTSQDIMQASYELSASGQSGSDYSFAECYFPSSGYDINTPDNSDNALAPLKLDTYFYNGDRIIGQFSFDSSNLNDGGIDPPVDGNGNPITGSVYLKPGNQINFNYEGFTVVSIQLTEWGDIEQGGSTDM